MEIYLVVWFVHGPMKTKSSSIMEMKLVTHSSEVRDFYYVDRNLKTETEKSSSSRKERMKVNFISRNNQRNSE